MRRVHDPIVFENSPEEIGRATHILATCSVRDVLAGADSISLSADP